MTVGRPITAGRSRDRCVSNVVSNPISDAARAPSPLYRARGQRRPSAASGLPIRNDFGTLSRVDRFQHGESQFPGLERNAQLDALAKRIRNRAPDVSGGPVQGVSAHHDHLRSVVPPRLPLPCCARARFQYIGSCHTILGMPRIRLRGMPILELYTPRSTPPAPSASSLSLGFATYLPPSQIRLPSAYPNSLVANPRQNTRSLVLLGPPSPSLTTSSTA